MPDHDSAAGRATLQRELQHIIDWHRAADVMAAVERRQSTTDAGLLEEPGTPQESAEGAALVAPLHMYTMSYYGSFVPPIEVELDKYMHLFRFPLNAGVYESEPLCICRYLMPS